MEGEHDRRRGNQRGRERRDFWLARSAESNLKQHRCPPSQHSPTLSSTIHPSSCVLAGLTLRYPAVLGPFWGRM